MRWGKSVSRWIQSNPMERDAFNMPSNLMAMALKPKTTWGNALVHKSSKCPTKLQIDAVMAIGQLPTHDHDGP